MTAKRSSAWMLPGRRTLLTLFCLLAFSLQTYIAQTHIHVPGSVDSGSSVTVAAKVGGGQPSGQDDLFSKCPLCQVVAAAGHAIGPDTILLFQPVAAGVVLAVAAFIRPAHSAPVPVWRNRGPPRA